MGRQTGHRQHPATHGFRLPAQAAAGSTHQTTRALAAAGKTRAQLEPIGFRGEAQAVALAPTVERARLTDYMGSGAVVVAAAHLLGQETEAQAENTEAAAGAAEAEPRPAGRAGRVEQATQLL